MFRRNQPLVIPHEEHHFVFSPDIAPALKVKSGSTVRFETSPAPAERLLAAQEAGHLGGETPEHEAIGVDDHPLAGDL